MNLPNLKISKEDKLKLMTSVFGKVTSFGPYLGYGSKSNVRIPLTAFLNLGPTLCRIQQRFDRYQTDSQSSQSAVEIVILRSGFVFTHAVVTNPVITYFAAAPVATRKLGKVFCTAFFRSKRADVEGHLRDFFGICGTGTADNRQAACSG